eukprot:SAG25_NODE_5897_length_608_cov_0.944990_1_plen_140_part_10
MHWDELRAHVHVTLRAAIYVGHGLSSRSGSHKLVVLRQRWGRCLGRPVIVNSRPHVRCRRHSMHQREVDSPHGGAATPPTPCAVVVEMLARASDVCGTTHVRVSCPHHALGRPRRRRTDAGAAVKVPADRVRDVALRVCV